MAEELATNNQLVKLDRLFHICRQELEVPSETILASIDDLVRQNRIRPGSRLIRKDLLQNALRREVYQTIVANPGISFSKLRRTLDRGTKILLWHVEVLVDFECVFEYQYGRQGALFSTSYQDPPWGNWLEFFVLFQDARVRTLLQILLERALVSTPTLQDLLAWPRQTIQYQLKKLVQRGCVRKQKEDGTNYYAVTPTRREAVRRVHQYMATRNLFLEPA